MTDLALASGKFIKSLQAKHSSKHILISVDKYMQNNIE